MKFKNEWFEWLRIYLFNRRGTSRVSAKTDFGNNLFHMSKGKHCYTAGFAGRGKLSWDGGGRRTMKVGGRRIFFESVPSRTEADGGPINFHPKRTEGSWPYQGRIRTADGENWYFSCCTFFNFAETLEVRHWWWLWKSNRFNNFGKCENCLKLQKL